MRKFMAIGLCMCMMIATLCSCTLQVPGFGSPSQDEITQSSVQPTDPSAEVTTAAVTTDTTAATTVATTTEATTKADSQQSTNGVLSGNKTKNNTSTTKKSSSKPSTTKTTKKHSNSAKPTATRKPQNTTKPRPTTPPVTNPAQIITMPTITVPPVTNPSVTTPPVTNPSVTTPPVTVPSNSNTTGIQPTVPTPSSQPSSSSEPTKPTPIVEPTTPAPTTFPPAKNDVVVYPENQLEVVSDVSMTVGGKKVQLNKIRANYSHAFNRSTKPGTTPLGMFDFSGSATVQLTYSEAVTSCVVRPVGSGIVPTVSGNTVTFTITKAGQYSVEINGTVKNAVMLFANNIEAAPSGNVKIVPAGIYKDNITINAGAEVNEIYLAPGAVVQGKILFNNCSSGKLSGKGIIDGSPFTPWLDNRNIAVLPIELWDAKNISISGVTIINPNAWCVQVQNSTNVTIDNIKMISANPNGDGISIQSSNKVTVTNSFIRTWDDSLVVKNYGKVFSTDITFDNCIVWNDLAQCMEIGYETNKANAPSPVIKNVNFKNITVMHALDGPVISIHNADNCAVSDITYNNIIVEDMSAKYLIQFNNTYSSNWSKVKERGSISNVTVDGVNVLSAGKDVKCQVDASSAPITGVKLSNFTVLGKKATSADDIKLQTKNATVSFS